MLSRSRVAHASHEEIHFAALTMGVNVKCSAKDLKSRYKELVRANHPDTGGNPERMAQITNANELLSRLSSFERDQFTTRSRFDRSGRNFSKVQYAYTYATSPRPPSGARRSSSWSKAIALADVVPEMTFSDFSRRCTIAAFLVGACAVLAVIWNAMALISWREVYHDNDASTNSRLLVLHEERQKLNADIANMRVAVKIATSSDERNLLTGELSHLIAVRQMLNEEIENCVAPPRAPSPHRNNDSSATLSPGLSIGMLALIMLLPRFCRVANLSAR